MFTMQLLCLLVTITSQTLKSSQSMLYVRNDGCDVGICSSNNTNYTNECSILSNTTEIYHKCCNLNDIFSRRTSQMTQINSKNTSITPAPTCLTVDFASHVLDQNFSRSGIIDIGYGMFMFSNPFNPISSVTLIGVNYTQ
eukprot:161894_1